MSFYHSIGVSLALVVILVGCDEDKDSNDSAPDMAPATTDASQGNAATDMASVSTMGDAELMDAQSSSDSGPTVDAQIEPEPSIDAGSPVPEPMGPKTVLGQPIESCDTIALLAPALPSEAGHYAAKILTPTEYPFAIDGIRYALISNEDVPTCSGAVAHKVLLFALDEPDALPPTPSAYGLGYREYDVPAEPDALTGRQMEITVPIPLVLTEGQSVAVAIQFAVENGRHPCVADCPGEGAPTGTDWWSNAAVPPFNWQDLVANFGLNSQLLIRVTGTVVE